MKTSFDGSIVGCLFIDIPCSELGECWTHGGGDKTSDGYECLFMIGNLNGCVSYGGSWREVLWLDCGCGTGWEDVI